MKSGAAKSSKKIILTFDCSSESYMIGLFRLNSCKSFFYGDLETIEVFQSSHFQNHSEELIFKISDLLKKNFLKFSDLDIVATTNGPGSFTGLRVAISLAKMIKISLKIPIILCDCRQIIAEKYLLQNAKKLNQFLNINNSTENNTLKKALVLFPSGKKEAFICKFELVSKQLKNGLDIKTLQKLWQVFLKDLTDFKTEIDIVDSQNIQPIREIKNPMNSAGKLNEFIANFDPNEVVICGSLSEIWINKMPNWLNLLKEKAGENFQIKFDQANNFNCLDIAFCALQKIDLITNNAENYISENSKTKLISLSTDDLSSKIFANYLKEPSFTKRKAS